MKVNKLGSPMPLLHTISNSILFDSYKVLSDYSKKQSKLQILAYGVKPQHLPKCCIDTFQNYGTDIHFSYLVSSGIFLTDKPSYSPCRDYSVDVPACCKRFLEQNIGKVMWLTSYPFTYFPVSVLQNSNSIIHCYFYFDLAVFTPRSTLQVSSIFHHLPTLEGSRNTLEHRSWGITLAPEQDSVNNMTCAWSYSISVSENLRFLCRRFCDAI